MAGLCTSNVEFDREPCGPVSWSHPVWINSQDCFCPCNTVVVFEMYSLIGSLVIMRDYEDGALTGTFTHVSRFKYGQFRHQTGLCAVQKWFMHGSIACMFIACAPSVKCDSVAHIKHLHV